MQNTNCLSVDQKHPSKKENGDFSAKSCQLGDLQLDRPDIRPERLPPLFSLFPRTRGARAQTTETAPVNAVHQLATHGEAGQAWKEHRVSVRRRVLVALQRSTGVRPGLFEPPQKTSHRGHSAACVFHEQLFLFRKENGEVR